MNLVSIMMKNYRRNGKLKKYYEEIISQYEKYYLKKNHTEFDISIKKDLGEFLNWLDKNKIQVWID